MIRELPESEGKVLGVEITGKVTAEEERAWIRRIEEILEEYASFSALVVLKEGARWSLKANWEDLKWLMSHQIEIDRIAVVCDSAGWKSWITLDIPFANLMGIGEKTFKTTEMAEAWAWVRGEGGKDR